MIMVYCGTSANKNVCPDPVWKPVRTGKWEGLPLASFGIGLRKQWIGSSYSRVRVSIVKYLSWESGLQSQTSSR